MRIVLAPCMYQPARNHQITNPTSCASSKFSACYHTCINPKLTCLFLTLLMFMGVPPKMALTPEGGWAGVGGSPWVGELVLLRMLTKHEKARLI